MTQKKAETQEKKIEKALAKWQNKHASILGGVQVKYDILFIEDPDTEQIYFGAFRELDFKTYKSVFKNFDLEDGGKPDLIGMGDAILTKCQIMVDEAITLKPSLRASMCISLANKIKIANVGFIKK